MSKMLGIAKFDYPGDPGEYEMWWVECDPGLTHHPWMKHGRVRTLGEIQRDESIIDPRKINAQVFAEIQEFCFERNYRSITVERGVGTIFHTQLVGIYPKTDAERFELKMRWG